MTAPVAGNVIWSCVQPLRSGPPGPTHTGRIERPDETKASRNQFQDLDERRRRGTLDIQPGGHLQK